MRAVAAYWPGTLLALVLWGIGQGARASWPDVLMGHWAQPGIDSMAARGLLAGYPDGRFVGTGRVTRYELAALLARTWPMRARGVPEAAGTAGWIWQDVPARHWARASLVWLVDGLGALRAWPGLETGYFSGAKPADRYELAVAVAAMLPMGPATEAGPEPGPAWARSAVQRVQASGVLVGFPDGRFHGERLVTRYEAALAFHKALLLPVVPQPEMAPAALMPIAPLPTGPPVVVVDPGPVPLVPEATPRPFNLPRVSLSFLPEYISELADTARGEATGWSMASSAVQADWADGPLTLQGLWRIAQYGVRVPAGPLQARQEYQFSGAAGYRWRWGSADRQSEVGVFGLGTYFGRRASGVTTDDLIGMDLQAFGLGIGAQLRWPVAHRLVAVARTEFLPLLGAQFGSSGGVSGQLGLVQSMIGLDWYLDRLSLGLGYRLRYLYDGQQHYSQWANGLQLKAGLAF
ncbi:MAG: S-layer homology domain-containing protein [Candidatus Sericytochromatia bacterium]|nr:S-layer homology domain-containing protein [Candidatus Sericytochromatia bacterium]